ncbi:uroporphyrinogen-III C-methyltransferase [Leeia sp. TBRC 13508]|uniref:uroporphyrinogen-III C-methyltransferase n=1 Tax=Leeia speluncae TaxID=2884804 RepID=A0ABS8D3G5_9NEIS|nr:uroporphyrinogen-III C-methyltransferase [Leeia speluncae]MCB6182208.1 uroporphyrinogen-III C-methyltransferase [Leeia speluncae]
MNQGSVVLIGAGPGDLDLLTLKAVKALAKADIVMLDDLVNPEIIQFAPQAKVIKVGKRGGCRSTPQPFILRLMRRYAKQGKQVARVKGGDPMIFGRAGEEIQYLQVEGIAVSVINGISSALAASASLNTSLTQRGMANGVTFITAHLQDDSEPDWQALARSGCTLAIYMGLQRVASICAELSQHLPKDTPAVAVSSVSTAKQQQLVSSISNLPQLIQETGFPGPAIILVGEAMGLVNASFAEMETLHQAAM